MAGPFVLILIVAAAYLAAHWAFEWLGTRYLLVGVHEPFIRTRHDHMLCITLLGVR